MFVAVHRVAGEAGARRTAGGRVVVRTGPGLVAPRMLGVDRRLRTTAE